MRDPVNWRSKTGILLTLIFSGLILNWLFPATYDIPGVSIWDMIMLLVIMAVFIMLGTYRYFYWNSPTIFTETDKVSTNANEVRPVVPDDARIPPQLMMPFGGYNVQRVYLGKDDMGPSGGVLFAPFYCVELLGQHLIVHGKPMAIGTDAVESNRWMMKALELYPEYIHGKTEVWVILWGEGPPLDLDSDAQSAFKKLDVQKAQGELVSDTEDITGKAYGDIQKKFRTIEDAREKPEAEKVILAGEEIKGRRKEKESD